MSHRVLVAEVNGTPIPQGSKRAFRTGDRVVIVDSQGQGLGLWRELIARTVRAQVREPFAAPVHLTLNFAFARPRGHYGKAGAMRPSAPDQKVTKPDLDKLVRAALDALTNVLYRDDAQVVRLMATKSYGPPGLTIIATIFE